MKTLHNKETCSEFVSRINKLNNHAAPAWGKMNVAQMVTHCQRPIELALGSLKTRPHEMVIAQCGKAGIKKLVSDPHLNKNIATFEEAKVEGKPDFETEKHKLVGLVEKYNSKGRAGITRHEHPLLGKMSEAEWDLLMFKHLDHHLRQFGV